MASISEDPIEREDIRETMMDYLRKHFFHLLNQSPELRITQIIQEQQEDMPEVCEDLPASIVQIFNSQVIIEIK